ncbi:MAG: glycosyltransferase [Acidimicrobiales bacterium]|nr:glycosyltransferase [Acidimicrobiales bacterium]
MIEWPDDPITAPSTSGDLADRLVGFVSLKMLELIEHHAPNLQLPGMFAGHPVLDDTVSDLVYVLGLLIECGVDQLADADGRPIPLAPRALELISGVDAAAVEGFYSYRVGETVLRLGGLDAVDPLLHEHVLQAVDSPNVRERLTNAPETIPPNFAVVATRCLMADARLRQQEPGPELGVFLERVRGMFTQQPNGWVNDQIGDSTHYDIYTPDMYLFAEPLTESLGSVWTDGFTKVLADLDLLVQPGGTICWGRSIGALGMAITIELAATATGRQLTPDADRWLQRAAETLDDLAEWFPNGVIAAHQHRAPMFYRGTPRRLQMTLDIYGKLLLAALELRRAPDVLTGHPTEAWPTVDTHIVFDAAANAGVWTHQQPGLTFAVPTLLGWSSDYATSPRGPGLFEQPTSGHPVFQPVISPTHAEYISGASADPLIAAGLPTRVEHAADAFTVEWERWGPVGAARTDERTTGGSRRVNFRVDGRSLVVEETLEFEQPPPGPVSITIPERAERPLDITSDEATFTAVDTSGVAEWRSFWGELPRVHQAELPVVGGQAAITYRVTPRLRMGSMSWGHPYDNHLYGPITDRVVPSNIGRPDAGLVRRLRTIDVLHMAWPEWWAGTDPARNAEVLDLVRGRGVGIVWTQHNLLPHMFKDDDAKATYQLWAEAADAVIHHSEVGRHVAFDTYRYGDHTSHHVIHHGHWGPMYDKTPMPERAAVEAAEGWAASPIRLAVVGAPRPEKDLQLVVDAMAASSRDDVQLVVRVADAVTVPDDPRIIVDTEHLDENRYLNRMAAFDALILPFAPHGMLTTGTAFDVIGAGLAAITSDWNFFDETFAGADIRYGSTAAELTACIDALTPEQLVASRQAIAALRPRFEWADAADATYDVLDAVASNR